MKSDSKNLKVTPKKKEERTSTQEYIKMMHQTAPSFNLNILKLNLNLTLKLDLFNYFIHFVKLDVCKVSS